MAGKKRDRADSGPKPKPKKIKTCNNDTQVTRTRILSSDYSNSGKPTPPPERSDKGKGKEKEKETPQDPWADWKILPSRITPTLVAEADNLVEKGKLFEAANLVMSPHGLWIQEMARNHWHDNIPGFQELNKMTPNIWPGDKIFWDLSSEHIYPDCWRETKGKRNKYGIATKTLSKDFLLDSGLQEKVRYTPCNTSDIKIEVLDDKKGNASDIEMEESVERTEIEESEHTPAHPLDIEMEGPKRVLSDENDPPNENLFDITPDVFDSIDNFPENPVDIISSSLAKPVRKNIDFKQAFSDLNSKNLNLGGMTSRRRKIRPLNLNNNDKTGKAKASHKALPTIARPRTPIDESTAEETPRKSSSEYSQMETIFSPVKGHVVRNLQQRESSFPSSSSSLAAGSLTESESFFKKLFQFIRVFQDVKCMTRSLQTLLRTFLEEIATTCQLPSNSEVLENRHDDRFIKYFRRAVMVIEAFIEKYQDQWEFSEPETEQKMVQLTSAIKKWLQLIL